VGRSHSNTWEPLKKTNGKRGGTSVAMHNKQESSVVTGSIYIGLANGGVTRQVRVEGSGL